MSDEIDKIVSLSKKTVTNAVAKQVRYPRSLLFSLVLVIIFALSVFIVKPNLQFTFEENEGREDENDFSKDFGSITIFFLVACVLPFIIWTYFREIIQYLLQKIFFAIQTDILDLEQQKQLIKRTSSLYFQMRKALINLHSIGGILGCIAVVFHMIGLFPYHEGFSFFFSWIAMLSGIYLASAGILLRFRYKRHILFTQKTSKIARAIHLQLIITLIGALAIAFHLSFGD